MTDLPAGWEWSTLGEIAEITQGQSPPGSSYNKNGVGIPFFQGKAEFGSLYPEARKWTTNALKSAQQDDILLSIRAPVGPTNLAPLDCAIGRGLAAIRACEGIDQRYLLWAVRASQDSLVARATGSTFEAVSRKQLTAHPIPVPPTAEQRRIVAILEDLSAHLDRGRSALGHARRSVPALIGGVRDTWTGSDSEDRLPSGWHRGRLRDVLAGIEAGKSFACESRPARAHEWGIIKVSAMTWGEFRPNENKAIPEGRPVELRNEIRDGDILVSRANTPAYVGAPVLVRDPRPRLLLSDKSLRLIPLPGVDREWLVQVLSARSTRRQITEKATGTKESMRNISQQSLLDIMIPIASPADQVSIGKRVRDSLAEVARLRGELERIERHASSLRRSLLAEAFAGRLVPQDPADEPASELLRRIRVERAKVGVGRRARKVRPVQEELS